MSNEKFEMGHVERIFFGLMFGVAPLALLGLGGYLLYLYPAAIIWVTVVMGALIFAYIFGTVAMALANKAKE